ncbi:hypothetical protein KI387_020809, partial [Taxus chinensis]
MSVLLGLRDRNSGRKMKAIVARTGRHQQRYDDNKHRLVAGCIPYRYTVDAKGEKAVEVLMVSSQSGRERLLFPK